MAIFQAFNTIGTGFNMTSTSSSGWSFMKADPSVTVDLVSDDGRVADYDVFGSPYIDGFTAWYESNGYDIIIDDLLYWNGGYQALSITGLNLYTTTEEMQGNAWYMTLNRGHDKFYGNDYRDIIRAGRGNDLVAGDRGNDDLYGDSGADKLYGEVGNDNLYGGSGKDYLSGGSGSDDLYGGSSSDNLIGGSGSDYLSGGSGSDKLTGGTGRDYFVFDTRPAGTVDRITDFRPSDDTIMLDNKIFTQAGGNGWLSDEAFTIGWEAQDSTDRVIYDIETGALLYDPDGWDWAPAIQIAQLKPWLNITQSDIYIL